MESSKNAYMDQVLREQVQLESDLRQRAMPMKAGAPPADGTRFYDHEGGGTHAPAGNAVAYRISGFLRWRNVVVPPNAWVVHTRRGHEEPLHVGLGVSFRFDPWTDAFIVVPSAMQTILINARSITRERQGVLVQGYVQWIVEDFKTAYRKCDFTDALDPMRLVNVQLREQAEAAIKDKVATMSIDEVLADKQPIIKELTERLRQVMEGDSEHGNRGLGLRIVTVQIKEAIVSSPTVWEMLQRPFRSERAKEARLAQLGSDAVVQAKEAEAAKVSARQKIETESEVARLKAQAESTAFDREQAEKTRRAKIEAESLAATLVHEKDKIAKKAEVARLAVEQEIAQEDLRKTAQARWDEREIALEASRRKVDNEMSPVALQARLVDSLPDIASKMPKPVESRTISIGPGADGIGSLVAGVTAIMEVVKSGGAKKA